MIRILLATDSELLQPRLRMMLTEIPDAQLVRVVTEETMVVNEVRSTNPDVVILSFPKLGQSTGRLVPVLRIINPGITIIALTMAFNHLNEAAWRNAGATRVFNLTLQLDELIDYLMTFAQSCLAHEQKQLSDDSSSGGIKN